LRLKKDVETINGALDKVLQLRGVSYYWKSKEEMAAARGKDVGNFSYGFGSEKQIGVIAQEIEEVLPELVVTDNEGFKAVKYENLTPVLIEAIKELKAEKDELKAEKDALDEKMKQYKTEDEKPVEEKNRLDDLRKQINENDDKRRDLYKEYGKSQKIVSQLFDLALLANNLLKGESLSKFVERSVDLLKK
jgi:hypothetical protein